eukprot:7389936-Prymnesium_polylepis.1
MFTHPNDGISRASALVDHLSVSMVRPTVRTHRGSADGRHTSRVWGHGGGCGLRKAHSMDTAGHPTKWGTLPSTST